MKHIDLVDRYTAEPWHTYSHDGTLIGAAGRDHPIANLDSNDRAEAARIVACVNALAGVEDPAAFMAAVRTVAICNIKGTFHPECDTALDTIRAALADLDS